MLIEIPEGQYLKKVGTTAKGVEVEFGTSKKIALLFICLNDKYWPYIAQVVKDCRKQFLPEHKVDYFIWTDYNEENKKKQLAGLESLLTAWIEAPDANKPAVLGQFLEVFTNIVRLYEHFYLPQIQEVFQQIANQGLLFKREGTRFWLECTKPMFTEADFRLLYESAKGILLLAQRDMDESLKDCTLIDTDAVPWPSPTLMRYHLFLNKEEELKEYDYLFYLDADMRVPSKIGDEVLSDGLTAAEHPMYSLMKEYIPPYEPNKESTAYIPRPGKVVTDENGKSRFKPYYYAGGFQGGVSKLFIEAMKTMKKNIDKDFDNNYTAIWNDESHWNRYLFDHEPEVVLSPAYIYPDSLIKEYYEPRIWGKSYEPKIITLTKPFTLSSQGAQDINKFIQGK